MFKLNKKLLVSISAAAALSLGLSACMDNASPAGASTPTKVGIDGGLTYPVVNGKTGPYHVNEKAHSGAIKFGRKPTEKEYEEWNSDVMADGTGLPEGEGTAEEGSDIYDEKCVMCHGDFGSGGGGYPSLAKGNAYELHETLKNQRIKPDTDGPVRVFGTYWPQASTLWWYIKDAMPHPMTDSLTDNEVYALVAYILNTNEMEIDGQEVDDEYVLNREKFLKIKMPNRDGFEPKIEGPQGPENVRKFFANPKNFGAQKVKPSERCMHNCQEPTAKVVYIQNGGIKDFHPPLSDVRDLPKEENKGFDAAKSYEANCAMCHGAEGMGAPVLGDKAAWSAVLTKGKAKVYSNGIHGINGMPPKGGASLSDNDFKSVVDYIINKSK
ncbi:c-type cytochrome [Sulfurimonas paralvinellae]|uniref:C-type cytochrome n=1 Tax=Sulfurimonas paralvinellae TaxID=317658 RepID=A0A7M1BA48_9BACT|nr:c-type cytochrome [Sulfurimonas paralvinellae]QOP46607.1 c-type cytochrome [Sulfurimonas paralvinellae]